MPAQVGREETHQQVRPDPVGAPVEDRPDRQVVALHDPEVALDRRETLVRLDDGPAGEPLGRHRGPHDVQPVEGGLGGQIQAASRSNANTPSVNS